ncbi:MAG: hypothetical protein MJ252_27340, partial [archaeon]|nr:hypothetical protein [archaeon]
MRRTKTASNIEQKKEKKKLDADKRARDIEEIMYKLSFVEQEQKDGAQSVISWVEKILNKKQLKLIHTLVEWIFDISKEAKEIRDYFHCIKLLLIINYDETLEKLRKEEDLSVRLIFYIRDTDSKDLCQDVFFILDAIIQSPEELKEYYTQEFIIRLFDILDLIEDDLNFRAVIKILVQINAFFKSTDMNLFMSTYRIHKNSRVLKEVIVRVLNDEKNRVKITQILDCLSNMMIVEKGNPYFFYANDLESFLDIMTVHLKFYYSEEMNIFALNVIEKLISFPDYFKDGYKVDEIREIVEDYIDKPDAGEAIKAEAQKIKDILDNPESVMNQEIKKEDSNINPYEYPENNSETPKKEEEKKETKEEKKEETEEKSKVNMAVFLNTNLEDTDHTSQSPDKKQSKLAEKFKRLEGIKEDEKSEEDEDEKPKEEGVVNLINTEEEKKE